MLSVLTTVHSSSSGVVDSTPQSLIFRHYDYTTDEAFVIDSWMRSLYDLLPFKRYRNKKTFWDRTLKVVTDIISHSEIIVAVDPEDHDLIVGYVVFEPDYLHYIYIKGLFRHQGLFDKLIQEAGLT
jgi:hypothetical protein